jgi:hypothetical protein
VLCFNGAVFTVDREESLALSNEADGMSDGTALGFKDREWPWASLYEKLPVIFVGCEMVGFHVIELGFILPSCARQALQELLFSAG